jgi:hypothetical protein
MEYIHVLTSLEYIHILTSSNFFAVVVRDVLLVSSAFVVSVFSMEKSQISAASLAKSFESSLKSTSTGAGRNVSLDTPRGWKSNSSKKKNEVKIEIIEKTDTTKAEETSKTSRTTTAKKLEEVSI